jgi:cell wall-associated NlpC family hydrolase
MAARAPGAQRLGPIRGALTAVVLVTASAGVATTGVATAEAATAPPTAAGGTAASRAAAAATRMRLGAWNYALHQRGKPYVWGGTGPGGFDCSGLVYAAYRSRHLRLPRTTGEMLGSWHLVRISKSQARRGDLAFFGTGHVELYDHGNWTYGAADSGSRIGYHRMNSYWHPTMYFRVRR